MQKRKKNAGVGGGFVVCAAAAAAAVNDADTAAAAAAKHEIYFRGCIQEVISTQRCPLRWRRSGVFLGSRFLSSVRRNIWELLLPVPSSF
jgi:hypothetical protein